MDRVYLPEDLAEGKDVILVGGKCYEKVGPSPRPPDTFSALAYNSCDDCLDSCCYIETEWCFNEPTDEECEDGEWFDSGGQIVRFFWKCEGPVDWFDKETGEFTLNAKNCSAFEGHEQNGSSPTWTLGLAVVDVGLCLLSHGGSAAINLSGVGPCGSAVINTDPNLGLAHKIAYFVCDEPYKPCSDFQISGNIVVPNEFDSFKEMIIRGCGCDFNFQVWGYWESSEGTIATSLLELVDPDEPGACCL